MRLLLNENLPLSVVESLTRLGHDVLWARKAMPGAADVDVIEKAMNERRLLITFDKDFGELVYKQGKKASVGIVLFRIPQTSAATVAAQVTQAIQSRDDWQGCFSVVEIRRIRMTPLP